MSIGPVFVWQKPFPEAWQRALDAAAPSGERLSRFIGKWEPGEPINPVQRWVIWQARPLLTTRAMLNRRYQGVPVDPRVLGLVQEHPRRNAKFDAKLGCYRKWGGGFAATDMATWELYHTTGRYAQRWWVVQGESGGHRYNLTGTEKKLLSIKRGGTIDVPKAGDLPYAPVDERVLARIRQLESVAVWHQVVQRADTKSHEQAWDDSEQAAAELARASLVDWLDQQFGETYQTYSPVYKAALREIPKPVLPKEDRPKPADTDAWRESFIKVGS